jgi:hypothetical protein
MSYTCVSPGIYRDSRTGNLFERPWIDGRRTYRKLKGRTITLAKEEQAAKRTDQARSTYGLAKDPYALQPSAVGKLMDDYERAGCPNRHHQQKQGTQLYQELNRLQKLRPFWASRLSDKIKPRDCIDYFNSRKAGKMKTHGGRAIDLELSTLNNILQWALNTGKVEINPLASRPTVSTKDRQSLPGFHAHQRNGVAQSRAILL